jgi:hypothetical protein
MNNFRYQKSIQYSSFDLIPQAIKIFFDEDCEDFIFILSIAAFTLINFKEVDKNFTTFGKKFLKLFEKK